MWWSLSWSKYCDKRHSLWLIPYVWCVHSSGNRGFYHLIIYLFMPVSFISLNYKIIIYACRVDIEVFILVVQRLFSNMILKWNYWYRIYSHDCNSCKQTKCPNIDKGLKDCYFGKMCPNMAVNLKYIGEFSILELYMINALNKPQSSSLYFILNKKINITLQVLLNNFV